MMTQSHRGKGAWLRLAATIPVIAVTFFAFGCGTRNQEEVASKADLTSETPNPSIFRIQVSGGNGDYSILCNGETTEIDKIGELVAEFYAGEEMYNATVSLSADDNVPMGIITDIKLQLRNVRALKVRYETDDSAIEKRMPPAQTSSPSISDDPYQTVNRRNIIKVLVNHEGTLWCGNGYVEGSLHNDKLYRQEIDKLKSIISNPTDSENCPSVEMRDIQMPDGSIKQFRVSNAMVTFQNDRGTSYDDYTKAMKLITSAYKELREELSAEVFGKTLVELSDAEMQVIYMAIPMNVSEIEPKDIRR